MIEESTQLTVHFFQDGEVEAAPASSPFFNRRPPGTMDIIRPEIDEEGLLGFHRLVDEGKSGIDEAGSDFGALHPPHRLAEALGIRPDFARFWIAGLHRHGQKLRAHALEIRQ